MAPNDFSLYDRLSAIADVGVIMPNWLLRVTQIAALATYVRTEFGKKAPSVSEADVQKARSKLAAGTN